MTVAELIQELSRLDPDRKVVTWDGSWDGNGSFTTPSVRPIFDDNTNKEMVWIA